MFKEFSRIGLVSTVVLNLISLPIQAQTATVQNGHQNANVSGTNNQVYQIINQTIINHPRRNQVNREPKKEKGNNGNSGHRERMRNAEKD